MSSTQYQEKSDQSTDTESGTAPPAPPSGPPAVTFPEGGLQAWLVVLGVFCVMFFTFGYVNAFGIYEAYYLGHQLSDESPSNIAWIGSIQFCLMFLGGLISGPITDRFGPKVIIYPSSLLFVVSIMLTSLCKTYYQFLLAQGILSGLANGLTYAPAVAILGHYFHARRALAMGIASSGSSLGGVLFPIILDRLLNHDSTPTSGIGFGWSVRIIGFLVLALCIVACITIVPRFPPRKGKYFLLDAFRHPRYSLQLIGLFLIFLGSTTPFFFLPSYALSHGLSTSLANGTISILNAGSLFGRLLTGPLSSFMGRFNLLFLSAFVSGILSLVWIACTTTGGIIVFAVLYGFVSGIVIALFPTTIAASAPHPSMIGTYVGMALGVLSISGLVGNPIEGAFVRAFDGGQGYKQAAGFAGAVMFVGSGFVVWARLWRGEGEERKLVL